MLVVRLCICPSNFNCSPILNQVGLDTVWSCTVLSCKIFKFRLCGLLFLLTKIVLDAMIDDINIIFVPSKIKFMRLLSFRRLRRLLSLTILQTL